jgi:hypothetical protein
MFVATVAHARPVSRVFVLRFSLFHIRLAAMEEIDAGFDSIFRRRFPRNVVKDEVVFS